MTKHFFFGLPWIVLVSLLAFIVWDNQRPREAVTVIDGKSPAGDLAVGRSDSAVVIDPICRMSIRRCSAHSVIRGAEQNYFCSVACREEFLGGAGRQAPLVPQGQHLMRGVPTGMIEVGVAVILVLSFGLFELLEKFRGPRSGSCSDGKTRFNLLGSKILNRLFSWPPLRFCAQMCVVVPFLFVICAGLFGNQNPSQNIAPLLTWTLWWVGLVFIVLFFGKAWCYVCPWDAIATWIEGIRLWRPRKEGSSLGLKWPVALRNIWLAVGLFLVLTWIDLGLGITQIPRATAYIGLGMLGLSIASALVFERKAFCRYACLVGRISGLYAMFGSLELRPTDRSVCGSCRTMDCFRGNEKGEGCPTFEFPKTMSVSTYCILCTECVKTCPSNNIAIQIRPWAEDLIQEAKPRADEALLAIILLSMTAFHGVTMTPSWNVMNEGLQRLAGVSELVSLTLWMVLFIAAPILMFGALARVAAIFSQPLRTRRIFLEYAYALLPIALFYHLAHNAEHFLMEGPRIISLMSDPFGWGWNVFGTAQNPVAPAITLEGLWMVQIFLVILGHIYSLWISAKITRRLIPDRRRAFVSQIPMLVAMVLSSAYSLWLLNQPMSMRTSGM